MAERENEDGRKMVWHEWGIGHRECRGSSRTGVRDKGAECRMQQRERERESAEGLEELRQLNHEDRHASELDSAETFGESERGELEESEKEGSWKASEAWRKLEIMSSWEVFTD